MHLGIIWQNTVDCDKLTLVSFYLAHYQYWVHCTNDEFTHFPLIRIYFVEQLLVFIIINLTVFMSEIVWTAEFCDYHDYSLSAWLERSLK